jgi:hypothetical protein
MVRQIGLRFKFNRKYQLLSVYAYTVLFYFLRISPKFTFLLMTYPTVSCLGVLGTTPARLVNPTVGLIPTTEFSDAGHSMEPAVSVPSVTAAMFAAAAIAEPVLDPHGSAESTYGFCTKLPADAYIQNSNA